MGMKAIEFLSRPDVMKHRAFITWLMEQEAPRRARLTGLSRYIVSHALAADGAFDAVAELWFEDLENARTTLAANDVETKDEIPAGLRRERLYVREHLIVDTGVRPRYKSVTGIKRHQDLSKPAFADWWLNHHAPMVVDFPNLRRYQVSLDDGPEEALFDGTAELWFDTPESMNSVMNSATTKSIMLDSEEHASFRRRVIVEEHVIKT